VNDLTYSSFLSNPPQEKGRRAQPRLGFSILAVAQLIGICCKAQLENQNFNSQKLYSNMAQVKTII
jgi:hypothetical protein